MTPEIIEHLKSMHRDAVDARHGYEEALEDAEGHGMTGLFREMIALHIQNADELANALTALNEDAGEDGSYMSTIHRMIMSIRGLFGGLDASVLPGLIDGETRNVSRVSDALAVPGLSQNLRTLLTRIRARLVDKITAMQVS